MFLNIDVWAIIVIFSPCVNTHVSLSLFPQKIENGRFAKYRYFAHAKVNDSDFLMITKRCMFFGI